MVAGIDRLRERSVRTFCSRVLRPKDQKDLEDLADLKEDLKDLGDLGLEDLVALGVQSFPST